MDELLSPAAWPHREIAAADRLILPDVEMVKRGGADRGRMRFYRHFPWSEAAREYIVQRAEQFAMDIDTALRMLSYRDPAYMSSDVHAHGLPVRGGIVHLVCDDDRVMVRRLGGVQVCTLRAFCGIVESPRGGDCDCLYDEDAP